VVTQEINDTVTVPFLSKNDIVNASMALLERHYKQPVTSIVSPIDVEAIVEKTLKYELVPEDFRMLFNDASILGATSSENKHILINSILYDDPSQNQRTRFTIAHEIGHVLLHASISMNSPHKQQLMDVNFAWSKTPSQVKEHKFSRPRDMFYPQTMRYTDLKGKSSRLEWQANFFASTLLVPPLLLDRVLRRVCRELKKIWYSGEAYHRVEELCVSRLRKFFDVSYEAMMCAMELFPLKQYFEAV
jgi:Zn-dependent peptidase ImmA (M78 family)